MNKIIMFTIIGIVISLLASGVPFLVIKTIQAKRKLDHDTELRRLELEEKTWNNLQL